MTSKPLQRHATYYENGRATRKLNATTITVNQKKEITCFRCKKIGHFYNECEEELPRTNNEKKGTNLLINKEDSSVKEIGIRR